MICILTVLAGCGKKAEPIDLPSNEAVENVKSDGVDLAPYHPLALRYGEVKGAAGLVTDIDGEWSRLLRLQITEQGAVPASCSM